MQCLYVSVTLIECRFRRGVYYGRLKMQCLCVAGTMTECLLRRGVCLWEIKNAVSICDWDHNRGSA